MSRCPHLDHVTVEAVDPEAVAGCEECLRTGATWVHLRQCRSCGHIRCCDSSPSRHASDHVEQTGHPIVTSAQPGEDWSYCYPDELMMVLRAAP